MFLLNIMRHIELLEHLSHILFMVVEHHEDAPVEKDQRVYQIT